MANTDFLEIPEISESQSGKYITHNEALRQIEAMLIHAKSLSNGGPPAGPSAGHIYIVDVKSGLWNVAEATLNDIAHYFGSAWHFYTPTEGVRLWIDDKDVTYVFNGSSWVRENAAPVFPSVGVGEATGTKGALVLKFSETNSDITASASVVLNVNVPTNTKLRGCQLRVNTALTSGESWDAEWNNGSSLQSIIVGSSSVQNTKVNKFFDENTDSPITTAETDIVITKNGGGSFTAAGNILVIAYYEQFTAMSSV